MNATRNYGLILPEKIETREEGAEHVLGGTDRPIINPSGSYMNNLTDAEPQSKNGVETFACTVYNSLSAIEDIIYFLTGIKVNYADKVVANLAARSGILNPKLGADPHKILELIRTISGLTDESRYPWTADITTNEQYYGMGDELFKAIKEGQPWYKEWKLEHEWLWTGNPTPQEKRRLIQEALKRGIVCVAVDAWNKRGDVYVKLRSENHWTGVRKADGMEPYRIRDSYDTFDKDLDPLYDFAIAKVIYLTPVPHLFLKNLGFQMMDEEVRHLQKALVSLNYLIPHAVTNVYGTETRSAVMAFQRDSGISDDGSHFGPRTRLALNQKLNPTAFLGGSFATWFAALFSGV